MPITVRIADHGQPSRFARDESGMTLIEVMAAIFILSVAILALAATATSSLEVLRTARDRQDATQLASSRLEESRALSWREIGFAPTDTSWQSSPGVSGGNYDTDGDGSADEDVVNEDPLGQLTHQTTLGNLTSRIYVTWVATSSNEEKRITSVVTWQDGGTTREVRQDTLVAEADRGLALPRFSIDPESRNVDNVAGQTTCIDTVLTNLGERDRYDWQLQTPDGDGFPGPSAAWSTRNFDRDGDGTDDAVQGFTSSDGNWFVYVTVDGQLTENEVGTTTDRIETVQFIERNDQVPFVTCYRPLSTPSAGATPSFWIQVRSAFDHDVDTFLTQSLRVVTTNTFLYFHHAGDFATRTFLMDETVPARSTGSPTTTPDYDTGIPLASTSGDGRAGLRVARGDSVRWDHQFTQQTQVSTAVVLRLFLSTDDALTGSLSANETLSFRVTLQRLTTAGGGTTTTLATQDGVHTQTSNGWSQVDTTVTIPSTQFKKNDYLRFVFECLNPSTGSWEDCHFHYDAKHTGSANQDEFLSGVGLTVAT